MLDVWVIAPEDLPVPPHKGGSVQIYTHSLIERLSKYTDISLTLVSPSSSAKHGRNILASSNGKQITVSNQDNSYLKRIIPLIKKHQPDVVQIENRPKFVHPIRLLNNNTKIILNLHSTTFVSSHHLSSHEAKDCFSAVDKVVCNSRYLQHTLINQLKFPSFKEISIVIHPGVDLHKFRGPSHKQLHSPVHLLYVGRIIRQKGLHVILKCLPILEQANLPFRLTVIGKTPPWEARYARLVLSLAHKQPVTWKGFIPPDRLPVYYQSADIFLCPSQQNEAFGLVNIEAMASGLPVIASSIGGIPESVTDECGVTINDYKSPASFAMAIQTFIENPLLWKQKSVEAKQHAKQFSWKCTARRFHRLYRSISK